MIKAICVFSLDSAGKLGTTWVPPRSGEPFKKPDTIQFIGVGGYPKMEFHESPFESGTTLHPKTYTVTEDAGLGLTIKTDAPVNKKLAFTCELVLPGGKVISYPGGDDVPVKNP